MKNRFSIASFIFILLQSFSFTSTAHASYFSWTGLQTIQLSRLNTHQVSYSPTQFAYTVPAGAKITRVDAYMSGDQINTISSETFVCWNGITNCVQMFGKNLTTQAFKDLDATRPIYVVIRVNSFGGIYPPAYVPTTINVYYSE